MTANPPGWCGISGESSLACPRACPHRCWPRRRGRRRARGDIEETCRVRRPARTAEKSAVLDAMQRDTVKPSAPALQSGRSGAAADTFRWTTPGTALWITPLCAAISNLAVMGSRVAPTVSARYLRIDRFGAGLGGPGRRLAGATACG